MNIKRADIVLAMVIDALRIFFTAQRYFKTSIGSNSVSFFSHEIAFPVPAVNHRPLCFANYLVKMYAPVWRRDEWGELGIFYRAILCFVMVSIHAHGALDYFLIGSDPWPSVAECSVGIISHYVIF